MIKNSLQIAGVVVVLLVFGFITLSPMFGLDLGLSSPFQQLALAMATALMFIMGLWYCLNMRKVQKLQKVEAHR